MRILYGIQGTGNGHLARARSLVPALRKAGIEIDFLFSGRKSEDFFNMELFPGYQCRQGFTLVVEQGRLCPARTLLRNNLTTFVRDVRNLNVSDYDLIISDFEPVTAWAAWLREVPCIGMSHQCAFHYEVPRLNGFLFSKMLMEYFAPVKTKVGFHWHHFDQPILPPLIEPHAIKTSDPSKILVYMGFESVSDIVEFLAPVSTHHFEVFARVNARGRIGNIAINPLSHAAFHRQLETCGGVISNAGFELASECLSLGKKLLIKPLCGQYEQLSNALALQTLNRASVIETLDSGRLRHWLELPDHRPIRYPDVAAAIAEWLLEPERPEVAELARRLWDQTDIPYRFNPDFGKKLVPDLMA